MVRFPSISLALVLVLLTTTLAIPPSGFFKFRHMDKYEPRADIEPGKQKQTNRDEILTRRRVRETTNQVRDLHRKLNTGGIGFRSQVGTQSGSNRKRALQPRASVGVRRRRNICGEGEQSGYARYPGWDLEFDDLPVQTVYVVSETECVFACTAFGAGCAGALYVPDEGGACYLKATAVSTGIFTADSEDALSEGTVLNLVGGCEAWTGIVPERMEDACCNN